MSAWGAAGRSCDGLLRRVEANQMDELVILSSKTFGSAELDRISTLFFTSTEPILLRSLYVSGKAVSTDSLRRFATALTMECCQLKSLAIGEVETTKDEGLEAFVEGLTQQPVSLTTPTSCRLEELDLSYNGHTAKGLEALCKIDHRRFTHLRLLNLSRNCLTTCNTSDNTLCSLPFSTLHELNVSSCSLNGKQIATLTSKLSSCQVIRASNNPIGDEGLTNLLTHHRSLEGLYVSNCGITNIILPPQHHNNNVPLLVSTLDLSKNTIEHGGLQTLCSSSFCTHHLDLSQNPQLDSADILCLANNCNSFYSLDLSSCSCSVDAAVALVTTTLKSLRLFDCHLGSIGLQSIATALVNNKILETLDVAGNGADQDAVVALIRAASDHCHTMTCLVVGGNAGGTEVEEAVRTVRPNLVVARDDQEN